MDIFTLILIPFLVGIFTNRVDAMLVASSVENVWKRLNQDDRQANQELEKILRVCFISALQTITQECHKELINSSAVQHYRGIVIYPTEHREELQWLDQKLKRLVKEIKLVKQAEYVDIPLKSIDEIALLLTREKQLVDASMEVVNQKLIAEALKDESVPESYAAKVKTLLFEYVRDNFASEIKQNPVIRDIVEAKLLVNINTNLAEQKLKIQDLEHSLRASKNLQLQKPDEARRRLKLEFDIEKLDAARLEAIVQHLQKLLDDGSIRLRRIEEGCMELIFDGSQKSLEKLDALINLGELTEILGIPVQGVYSARVSSSPTLVNLSQWLQNIIELGWQTIEEIFGEQTEKLVFARSGNTSEAVLRAQQIHLETEASSNLLALVVAVQPTGKERKISLQLHPLNSKTLPPGIKCCVFDISGTSLLEVQAKNTDKRIQLNISGKPGEQFSVQIQLDETNITRSFVI